MTAQQLDLFSATNPPTYTDSLRLRICYECGATPARPHAGEKIPYCAACRKKHEERMRKLFKEDR